MTQKIDAKGLICPEPIMLLHRAIHEAKPGDVIELIATDPTSEKDVEKFCEYLNHELISKEIKKELSYDDNHLPLFDIISTDALSSIFLTISYNI